MLVREFVLDLDKNTQSRIRFTKNRKGIKKFTIQLELIEKGKIKPVVRYDTAHGYAHRHQFYRSGEKMVRRFKFRDLSEAYTYSYNDVKLNWRRFKNEFERRK